MSTATKSSLDALAVFGGAPAFERKLHVGQPNLGDRAYFLQRVERILDSRWFTNNGECVQELERELAAFLGVRNVIAVCNATIGLEIAIRALPMSGEVIVPAMTFIATAHALQWQQITPVFCDIDPATHVLDPVEVEKLITDRTTGILGVHVWGRECNIDALDDIARRHGLHLMFDAAHAFGCSHRGRMIGGFGRAEVFSFHATKFFNSFEGGAIATDDDALAKKIRLMTNFGFAGYDNVVHIGTNGKMSEVSAAMGLTSLRALPEFVETNRRNHHAYRERLACIPGMQLFAYDEAERCNWQYVVVEYTPAPGGPSRDQLVEALWAENVMARKYFWPGCHRMEPYRTLYPRAAARLPHTDAVAARLLILPTGTGVSGEDIQRLCDLLALMVGQGPALRERLAGRTSG
ncbi:aminotransferase class I/II-fold pyridoxal phosphate-dependent enzyme [Piscinibacter defluvii]|uniref:aminotransferase class I/II-fold pyridoxal phosphate-dependent enzyme n=1 Tax=Piscinibacter defluvii TaxID=1796922 RepID=UPI000FDD4C8D|nr:aminotransferase class I/II-fold pyridoxal phosphate-dependent enzyme [Piscinibacter defluvii]